MQHLTARAVWRGWLRPTAGVVVAAQLALALQPLSALAQQGQAASPAAQAQIRRLAQWQQRIEQGKLAQASAALSVGERASERTSRNLAQVHTLVQGLHQRTQRASLQAQRLGQDRQDQQNKQDQTHITTLLGAIQADTQAVLGDFASQRTDLQARGASPEILRRHDQAQTEIEQRASELAGLARQWAHRPDSNTLTELGSYFQRHPAAKTHTPLDPQKLPWSSPKPNTRMPATTKTAWFQNLYKDQKIQLASAASVGGIQFNIPPEPGQAPTEADLATTPEVTQSSAIKAKAAELGNNPVAIHNWVRNVVEWVPTWGAIQNADSTLASLRGNAFDIASLEIALLRSANIPARYQFGTIEIPVDKVQNWVGGTTSPQAALQLLNQGGIAATGLARAGVIQAIRMEHVWVHANVNWSPSRGNRQGGGTADPNITTPDGILQHVNPNGLLNAWVPLDGSYKQYDYAPGMDLKTAVPVNGPALTQAVQQGATVTSDYVQNLNQAALQTQMTGYQNQVRAYINNSPTGRSSTIDDVLGKKAIKNQIHTQLAGTLPYTTALVGNQTVEVPDGQRWKVDFYGYELDGAGGQGNTLIRRIFNLSELLQRRVGITYEGATATDQQAMASLRISGATSFPAYTLKVKPLFQIDGITVVSGDAVGMAKDVEWQVNIIPAGQTDQSANQQTYAAAAGDETVWAVTGDSISAKQLSSMSFPSTAAGNLHAVGMSYWHQVDAYASLLARRESAVVQRMPSLGAVSSGLRVQFIWGIPRSASYLGRTIDVGHSTIGVVGMNPVTFQREQGMRTSYLEGDIFDQVFHRETGSGVSAARLMQTAMDAGFKVFTLTSANADQFLGRIQMSNAVREEVIDALLAGLEVTIPESEQNVSGWQGTAYIAIRPESGAGAYMISGSLRGGAEGGGCELQPSTEPANATNFSPAVLFAAAIIAAYLIANIGPVIVGVVVFAISQAAVAAPIPQLPPPLDGIWNRVSGSRPWPTQFNWPPAYGTPPLPYGSCTDVQQQALQSAVKAACNRPHSCAKKNSANDSCVEIQEKIDIAEQCIVARIELMDMCYQGGDEAHFGEIEKELKSIRTCSDCKSKKVAARQCIGNN